MSSRDNDLSEGRVSDIYRLLKERAVAFSFRPGDRLNEVALARELGVSRTPLREALNRLVAERFFEFRPGTGFFCRPLDARTIYDLYELRRILEVAAVGLACERASQDQLDALSESHRLDAASLSGLTVGEAVLEDEAFHIDIARLTGNASLQTALVSLNERIRIIRWVDMAARTGTTKQEHMQLVDALRLRDGERAGQVMARHIARRMDEIVQAVKTSISNIYTDGSGALFDKVISDG